MSKELNKPSANRPKKPRSSRPKPGGRPAIRGFLLQTLVCVFDALDPTREWNAVKFEPESMEPRTSEGPHATSELLQTAEKLDIIWQTDRGEEGQQIRSRTDTITPTDVRHWTEEMRAAHLNATSLELILVGHTTYNLAAEPTCHGVKVTQSQAIGPNAYRELCASRLDRFLEANRAGYVSYQEKHDLVNLLAFDLLFSSQSDVYISRDEMRATLLRSLKRFRSWGPRDLRRERREREDFKSIYGLDAGPVLRAAVVDCYAAVEEELNPKLFGYARRSLRQEGGRLQVRIDSGVRFDFRWSWVTIGLVSLFLPLLPAMAVLERMSCGASWLQAMQNQAFGVVAVSCTLLWLVALLVLFSLQRPYVCARQIAKKLEELEALDR